DDIIFRSTMKSLCDEFEQMMHKRFQMSSIRKLTFFLGLQVKQKDDGIFISQDKYVADILKKFDFTTVKTTSTLMEPNKALIKDAEAEDIDRAIGTKWVFRNKKDEREIVVRNKARLVAQGYTQEEGINYDEVFAHVARIEEIRSTMKSLCDEFEQMKPNKALIKDAEAEDIDVYLYRSMIGSLMCLIASRPDIMFVVCACARFQVTPKTLHLQAIKRIFR
nr:ribonuclease H-like domain-containing protein [Tanacetum cinerariifolium]